MSHVNIENVELSSLIPCVSIDDLQYPGLHLLEGNALHVWIRGSPLLRGCGLEVIHHLLQLEDEVTLELGPWHPREECIHEDVKCHFI